MSIEEFVKLNGFNKFEKNKDYNEYKCYEVWDSSDEDAFTGYPTFALEKNGKVRFSTLEETIKIM